MFPIKMTHPKTGNPEVLQPGDQIQLGLWDQRLTITVYRPGTRYLQLGELQALEISIPNVTMEIRQIVHLIIGLLLASGVHEIATVKSNACGVIDIVA